MKKLKEHYQELLIDRFGSRRGVVRTFWFKLKYGIGIYNNYKEVDWSNVDRLVFVCKGNICRSAYAEVIAKSLGVDAISCGVSTKIGLPANKDAIKAADKRGIDLSEHKTTPVMSVLLRKTDLMVVMEPWHAESLTKNLKRKHYMTLLGIWSSPVRPHIQDPYGFSSIYFNNCFAYIEKSVNEITQKIKNS